MAKILLYTDNHFSSYSSIIRSNGERYSTRLENQIQSLNWVNEIAVEHKCDLMIHLGDFFDKPELNAQELSALKEIKWNSLPKKFIVGNHEMGDNSLTYNSLNALAQIGDIIDKPTIDCGFGFELVYLPYIVESNRKPLVDYIKETQNEFYADCFVTREVKHRIILSHNDIKGLQYGQFISKCGFELEEIYNNCSLFINGHLHNQTQINDKMLNLGNLTGQNFSEDGFKYSHCIAILDTDTLKVELINNPYAFYFYKIETNNIDELKNQINKLDKNYAIGTIKVFESDLNEARLSCAEHFKEYRLITKPNNLLSEKQNMSLEDSSINHIQKFRDYVLSELDNNEILFDELAQLE